MSSLREAAQQALEALEHHGRCLPWNAFVEVRKDLRAALAQEQAEPVQDQRCRAEPRSDGDFVCDCKIGGCPGRSAEPAQQAEPVAWMVYTEGGTSAYVTDNPTDLVGAYRALSLYTAPPQRTMVPLTEKEIKTAFHAARNAKLGASQDNSRHRLSVIEIARAVERAHGIKE